jgi:hypothetical protein
MHFQIYMDRAGQWRWRLRAANHKIVADSAEGYRARGSAIDAINLIADTLGEGRIAVVLVDA